MLILMLMLMLTLMLTLMLMLMLMLMLIPTFLNLLARDSSSGATQSSEGRGARL